MRYAKAIAAVLGGLTPAAVVGILAVFHVTINPDLVSEIYAVAGPILAGLFTARGPANKVEAAVVAAVVAAKTAVEKPAETAPAPEVPSA